MPAQVQPEADIAPPLDAGHPPSDVALPAIQTASPSSSSTPTLPSQHACSASASPPHAASTVPSPRPAASLGWHALPAALFDQVCSYVQQPVYDTLLTASRVCEGWRQLVHGVTSGHFDCWRRVPTLTWRVSRGPLTLVLEQGSISIHVSHWQSALHALRRVPSLHLLFSDASMRSCVRLLDLLHSLPPAGVGTATRHVHLQATCDMRAAVKGETKLFSAALSHFMLHCPPLRSFALAQDDPLRPGLTTVRHVVGSGLLVHLELRAAELSRLVWGHEGKHKTTQPWQGSSKHNTTQPWQGASSVQSLVLHSPRVPEHPCTLEALRLLPALTHLHLERYHRYRHRRGDAMECIAQHLPDRLTFLRLHSLAPLPRMTALHSATLQSLHLTFYPLAGRDTLCVLEQLHLMPRLTELTLIDSQPGILYRSPVVLPPLPATLTYLQLLCWSPVRFSPLTPVAEQIGIRTVLPPSLLCLSLSLPSSTLTEALLSSIPAQCAQLRYCHLDVTRFGWVGERREWTAMWDGLKEQLGPAVRCVSADVVEQQRLDRRWQREAGVELLHEF